MPFKDPEAKRVWMAAYRARNQAVIREQGHARRCANREHRREYRRKKYAADREIEIERSRQRIASGLHAADNRRYRQRQREMTYGPTQ